MGRLAILLVCLVPLAASWAPIPKEDEARKLMRAYGDWIDPDKDCKYVLKESELRVSIPAAWHLLWPMREGSKNNAPRVLRDVEGDFTAVVRVTFPIPENVPKENWPCCTGGLIAWKSDDQHFIVRRCGGQVNGGREVLSSHHTQGRFCRDTFAPQNQAAQSAYLSLRREKNTLIAAWSRDGKSWKDLGSVEVAWGKKLKVGLLAENCLGKPVEITFDHYSLTQPKK